VSYKAFREDFNNLVRSSSSIKMIINCYGGDMLEGFAMYDLIRNATVHVTGLVEGIAASMGSVFFQACHTRQMVRHGRQMIHKVQGAVYGEAQEMKNYIKLMESLEEQALAVYAERTGKTIEEVRAWMVPNQETWMTAQECMDNNLCDEIVDGQKPSYPDNIFSSGMTPARVWNIMNPGSGPSKQTDNNTDTNMKKPILQVFNTYKIPHTLTEESTDKAFADAVENALKDRDDKIKQLTDQIDEGNTERINNLLDKAVEAGKLSAEDRPTWENVAKADFASAEKAIEKMAGREDVNNNLDSKGKGPKGGSKGQEDRKDWDYRKWEKEDPKGLTKMKKEDPEAFNTLFNKFYGGEESDD